MQDRKTAQVGKKRPRAYRGEKKEKKIVIWKKKSFVGWKNKMLVEKKCRLEKFHCQKRTCPECPEFPVMQDQKTAEVGKKRPRAYRGEKKGKKVCRLEKKKMADGEFPLPKTDMSGMSRIPCNARLKNSRGGEKPPRAYREEKTKLRFFFVGWEKKASGPE